MTLSEARAAGLARYQGSPCPRGHSGERYVSNYKCVICLRDKARVRYDPAKDAARHSKKYYENIEHSREISRERVKRNYAKRADVMRERNRAKYAANPDYYREKSKAYRRRNPGKAYEVIKRQRAADPEPHRIAERERKRKNPERFRAEVREWQKSNPDKCRAQIEKRRARKAGAGGVFTAADIAAMFVEQNSICAGCGCEIHAKAYTVDHKTPLCRGGSNDPSNLQLLCRRCNSSKGAKTMEEWREMLSLSGGGTGRLLWR